MWGGMGVQDGRIWAMQLPFWRTKFCPAHAEDGTPKCAGCARMQPVGQAWVEVQKGRHLCLDCLDSVVVDTQDAQPLYNKVGTLMPGPALARKLTSAMAGFRGACGVGPDQSCAGGGATWGIARNVQGAWDCGRQQQSAGLLCLECKKVEAQGCGVDSGVVWQCC